ncbi:MAG: hypothetical protein WCJ18_05545 [Planctomycetota bacterium]
MLFATWLERGGAARAETLPAEGTLEQAFLGAATALTAAMVLACGLVLCGRRLTSGFESPPGPTGLLAVAAAGVGLVLVVDVMARAAGGAAGGWPWSLAARTGLVLALAAVAVPPRLATPLEAVSFAAALLFAGTTVAGPWLVGIRNPASRPSASRWPADGPGAQSGGSRPWQPPQTGSAAPSPAAAITLPCPGHLTQRFERYEAAGNDHLRGTLALAVPQGARTASGHVGFCPPFAQLPIVEVTTTYDGVEAIVSAAEVLPWGLRIECRLDEPAEEAFEIPVDVFVTSPI